MKPIQQWDEALPLGNGLTGCLVWGDGAPLRFSLDRADLWDKRPAKETLADDYNYQSLMELVKNKDQEGIVERFEQFYMTHPTPTKLPAGRIELDFGMPADNMMNHLQLYTASSEVKLTFGKQQMLVTSYLHANQSCGFIRITGTAPLPVARVIAPKYEYASEEPKSEEGPTSLLTLNLDLLGYPRATMGSDGLLSWFHQQTSNASEYAVVMGQKLIDAQTMEITYTVGSSSDGIDWLEKSKNKVLEALHTGFEASEASHRSWWNTFWSKSAIVLPDKECERLWYLSNYFLGSCSRKGTPPMPLQGVWTADHGFLPPWKGDYHHDLNTQMSYSHYMKANHLEEGESFLDFLWDLIPQGRKFAREFFDAPGVCLPSVMSIDGQSLGGWVHYSTNLVNQMWLCQAFDHYWLTTGDEDFLRNKAYFYFKETASCIQRWLKPGDDGKLILPLSSSPEIHNNSLEAWLRPNSNNDLALLRYLFGTLAAWAERLQYKAEAEAWEQVFKQLPELSVNENNVLMLSPDESLQESHRHLSHAMAIYPLRLISYNGTEQERQIIDATIGNLEILGKGFWVGFSFAWMANLYAIQGNGEAAHCQLRLFWDHLCSPNGFHLNGDYKNRGVTSYHDRAFTLESNMGAADALQEMLLENDKGLIKVFPAIPQEWREEGTSFNQFRGCMGVLVSAEIRDGRLAFVELIAEREGIVQLWNDFGTDELVIQPPCEWACNENVLEIKLVEGQRCMIACKPR